MVRIMNVQQSKSRMLALLEAEVDQCRKNINDAINKANVPTVSIQVNSAHGMVVGLAGMLQQELENAGYTVSVEVYGSGRIMTIKTPMNFDHFK